jgi:RHS repeat-associated protein
LSGGVDRTGGTLTFGEVFDPLLQRTRIETTSLVPLESGLSPELEASLPPDQSTDVPVDALVALRFSKPLNVVTVNSQTATLSGPQGLVQVNVVPAEGGMLAFVIPGRALLSRTRYTLSLSGMSDDTNPLSDTILSFTTAGTPSGNNGQAIGTGAESDDTGSQALNSPWRNLTPLEAPVGATAVSGQVLRLNGMPLENVTISVQRLSVTTDTTGRFLLSPLSAGHLVMLIDGRTANRNQATYGVFEVGIDLIAGKTNVLPYTIWMPKLDMAHAVTIPSPTPKEVVVTTPLIPGLELHLPPQTVIRDHDGKVTTQISLTPIPLDRPPFPLAKGVSVPLYFTIQPGSGYVEVQNSAEPDGAWLVYPNAKDALPGTPFDFWNYDPDQKGWYIYGEGKVQPDGERIVPNPGVVIYEFTGAMVALPSDAPPNGPAPGNPNTNDGDPVDLGTGLFVLNKTDLFLPDIIPIALTRTYRPGDARSRGFGIGSTHPYDIFLVGDSSPFTFADLILPNGGRIHYQRTSPGTGFIDAVYQHTSSPTIFYGSTITFNEGEFAWDLKLKNGTVLVFGAVTAASIPTQTALLAIRDRYGNVLHLTRDSSHNLTAINSPNGRWLQLTYDTSNRVTKADDNAGRTVTYTYDSLGRLSAVKDPNGGQTVYTYDTSNQMLSIKDARGIVYLTNQYDSKGRVVRQTLANSGTFQFKYTLNAANSVIETDVTNPRGVVRKVNFNSSGYVVTDIRALGKPEQQTIMYGWQANTNLCLSFTDPLDRKTTYTYDVMGNVTSITRLASTLGAVITSFTYEPRFNQLTRVTDPLNHTASFSYDTIGNLTAVTDPLKHRWTLAYNGAGQPVSLTNPLGNTTQFTYAVGDFVGITDPLGHTQTRIIDDAGRLIALTDSLGNVSRYSYDSFNDLTEVVDPLGGATKSSYDANGNLLSVTDARNDVTRYNYDTMDRLVGRTDPLSRTESYQYDLAGNLTQFTDRRGKATKPSYDSLNRTISLTFGSESTITNTYDRGNRLTRTLDSLSGAITRTYDGLDRLTSETTPQGMVTYTYDAAGRRTSMNVSGQLKTSYTYDDANRLTKITQGGASVSFTYDSGNRRTAETLPNGVVMSYSYDRASRITGLSYTRGSATLGNLIYTYDEAGRRTSVGGSMARTTLPEPISSATYDAANELTKFDAVSLTYDADGNLIGDGTNNYAWNTRRQLIQITFGSMSFASFQYDAFGRRQGKTVSGLTTHFLYDGPNVVQELANTKANLLTGLTADEIFSRSDAIGSHSFLPDALGSTLALTDPNGKIQTQYMYAPFGDTISSGSPSTNSFQYTGRENDGTGLYYYRARYYSPAYNRFISEDPLEFAAGDSNFYAYARNSPTNLSDPSGESVGACTDDQTQSLSGRKNALAGLPGAVLGVGAAEGVGDVIGAAETFGAAAEAGPLVACVYLILATRRQFPIPTPPVIHAEGSGGGYRNPPPGRPTPGTYPGKAPPQDWPMDWPWPPEPGKRPADYPPNEPWPPLTPDIPGYEPPVDKYPRWW